MPNSQQGQNQDQGQDINRGNFANDTDKASEAGQKGGKAAQQSGNAHEFTPEERSEGGSNSNGNSKNDSQKTNGSSQNGEQN